MKKTYRIFHLIKSLGRGGAEVLLGEGLGYADRSRFQYGYGYFLPWKNALVPSLEKGGASVVCFNRRHFPSMLISTRRVAQFLKEWGADLIHCHLPLAGVIGRLAARSASIPVVYTEHNVMERYHPWTRRLNLMTWKMQDQVVAVSREVGDSIRSHAGTSVPVLVVQNGVPVDSFVPSMEQRASIRRELAIPEESPVVGMVAVFRPQKDLKRWLESARLIRNAFPSAHFLMVGDGPLMKEVRATAEDLRLADVTHFVGLQPEIRPYLSAMDAYMSSSLFEGLPLSLLEAMAMKLPVVATSVGGVPEVIVDGRTGYIVPPGSPEMLAEKICLLLSNEQMRHDFGLAGRSVIEERFSMNRMVQQLEDLYVSLIEKRPIAN